MIGWNENRCNLPPIEEARTQGVFRWQWPPRLGQPTSLRLPMMAFTLPSATATARFAGPVRVSSCGGRTAAAISRSSWDARIRGVRSGRPISRSTVAQVGLGRGWHWYSLDLGSVLARDLAFEVDGPIETSPGAPLRGVMMRSVVWHDSAARHSRIERVRANQVLNDEEYRSGAVVLRSVPPYLRLTIEVRCNIANDQACVYCAWKWMKREEIGSPDADLAFVESLGRYLDLARVVNDSSYGEPPLHHEFAEIVDLIAQDERAFSFASNGKTLRRKIRRALLGRNVFLYVSIDSASSAGFARYRDHSFDRIIADLRTLCREKKTHGTCRT